MASELGVQTIQHTNGTDALTIGSDGVVTASQYIKEPAKPMLFIQNGATSQTVTSSPTTIDFDTPQLDTVSGWNASTNEWTPGVAGYYQVDLIVRFSISGTTHYIAAYAVVGGSNYQRVQYQLSSSLIVNSEMPFGFGLVYIGASDTLKVNMQSGSTITVGDQSSGGLVTKLNAYLVHQA